MSIAMRCYVGVVRVAAAGVIAMAPWSHGSVFNLLLLSTLAVAADRVSRFQISARGASMSVSLVVTITAVVILPPPGAALVGLASGLLHFRRGSVGRALTNAAIFALIPAAGSWACDLMNGREDEVLLRFPDFLVPFFASVTVCLALNGILVASYVSLSGQARFLEVWRSDFLRATLPYYVSSVLALIILVLWKDIGPFTVPLVAVPMYTSHWVFSQYSKEQAAYEGTISALIQAVEIKDHYTRGHSERVAKGSELIARRIAMAEERIAKLRYAGLLHDIGKLGVPTRLLAKPGKLTDEEYALLCLHPNQGVAVIRDIRFLTDVYDGILHHHERLDGRGYPSGRSGDDIPEFARILGVADAFDAMTSTRSYRAARPVAEAVAELWRGAGTQFDPELVRAFEEALALQEAAGHPWQVTDEPVPTIDPVLAGVAGAAPAFVFEDHDDPMVELEWYPNRIGAGEHMVREAAPGAGVGDGEGRAVEGAAETVAEDAGGAENAGGADATVPDSDRWFVRVDRLGRVDRPQGTVGDAETVGGADRTGMADTIEILGVVGVADAVTDTAAGAVADAVTDTAGSEEPIEPGPVAQAWEPSVPLGGAGGTWVSGLPPVVEAGQPASPFAWRDRFEPAGRHLDGRYDNVFPIRPDVPADLPADLPLDFRVERAAGFPLDQRAEGPGA